MIFNIFRQSRNIFTYLYHFRQFVTHLSLIHSICRPFTPLVAHLPHFKLSDIDEVLSPIYPICEACDNLERQYKSKSDMDMLAYDNADDCMPDWQDPYYFIKHVPPLPEHLRFRKPGEYRKKFITFLSRVRRPGYVNSVLSGCNYEIILQYVPYEIV